MVRPTNNLSVAHALETLLSATRVGRLSLLGVVSLLQLGAVSCSGPNGATRAAAATAPAVPTDSADQVLFGMRSVLTDRGVTNGILSADTALVYAEGARHDLRHLTLSFTDTVGISVAVLTAQRGSYDALRGKVEARGQVVIIGKDGRRLQTEQLTYDVTRNIIHTDAPYTLTEPNAKRPVAENGFEFTPLLRTAPRAKPPVPSSKTAMPKPTAPPSAKP